MCGQYVWEQYLYCGLSPHLQAPGQHRIYSSSPTVVLIRVQLLLSHTCSHMYKAAWVEAA